MELFLNLHMLKLWAGQPRQYPHPDPVKTHGIPLLFYIRSHGSQISNTHSLAPCMPLYTPGSCLWTSHFCFSHGLPISSIRLPPSHSLLRHGPHFSGQYSLNLSLLLDLYCSSFPQDSRAGSWPPEPKVIISSTFA